MVAAAGGTPQPLTAIDSKKGEVALRWPEFLPGANAVLFAVTNNSGNFANAQVALYALKTGERRNLISGGVRPRYAPTGHLVYVQGGTLMAVPFDLARLQAVGAGRSQ